MGRADGCAEGRDGNRGGIRMNIHLELDKDEHPTNIKIAAALIRFLFSDADAVEEVGEHLLTWARHEREVMKGETLR